MSIIVSVYLKEGIVMSADTMTAQTKQESVQQNSEKTRR